MLVNNLFQQP